MSKKKFISKEFYFKSSDFDFAHKIDSLIEQDDIWREGTTVITNTYSVHMDPDHWKEINCLPFNLAWKTKVFFSFLRKLAIWQKYREQISNLLIWIIANKWVRTPLRYDCTLRQRDKVDLKFLKHIINDIFLNTLYTLREASTKNKK